MLRAIPPDERLQMQQQLRQWEEHLLVEVAKTKALLLSEGNSDAATDAAERLWCMLEDYPGRRQFLRWCWWRHSEIGERPYSRVLAMSWTRPRMGSLRSWGFRLSDLRNMFRHAASEYLMDPEDFSVFKDLPQQIVAYRGCSGGTIDKVRLGMSWTLNIEKAFWFAKRCPEWGAPICLEATINKKNVFAYFDSRNEREIVVYPGRVSKVKAVALDPDVA
jgi:hypothetical protein